MTSHVITHIVRGPDPVTGVQSTHDRHERPAISFTPPVVLAHPAARTRTTDLTGAPA